MDYQLSGQYIHCNLYNTSTTKGGVLYLNVQIMYLYDIWHLIMVALEIQRLWYIYIDVHYSCSEWGDQFGPDDLIVVQQTSTLQSRLEFKFVTAIGGTCITISILDEVILKIRLGPTFEW